ncbi:MAG: cyclase family protein [Dehalococcoidia bacterium]
MTGIDFDKLPRFSQLPVKPGAPPDSSWGVFGDDDELGCLNFLTEKGVLEASRLVKRGRVFRLDMPIGYADPPLFSRTPTRHTIMKFPRSLGHDDKLDEYNTQEGSQWDGFGHQGHAESDCFYNGVKLEEIKSGPGGKLGIHLWANKMVGRGVLIDAFKYRDDQGRPLNPCAPEWYTLKDLETTVIAQGVELKPGDILMVRTGWLQYYLNASTEERRDMGDWRGLVRHRFYQRGGGMALGPPGGGPGHRLPGSRDLALEYGAWPSARPCHTPAGPAAGRAVQPGGAGRRLRRG